jgi:hypothetical protein
VKAVGGGFAISATFEKIGLSVDIGIAVDLPTAADLLQRPELE